MQKQGFTLVEVVLVVGLLLILVTATGAIRSSWYQTSNISSAYYQIISSLRKAQAYAIDNKNDAVWGVCLTGTTVRLFSGSCASPNIKNDFILPSDVTLSGLGNVTFSSLRGEPTSPQAITVIGSGTSKTININLLGGFDLN